MNAKKTKSSAQEKKKPTEKKKKPEFHEDSLNFEESKNGIDQNSKKGVSEPIIKNMSLNENNERHQKQIIELKTEIKKLKEESENWKKILEIKEKDWVELKISYDLARQNKFQASTHSTTPKYDRKKKQTILEKIPILNKIKFKKNEKEKSEKIQNNDLKMNKEKNLEKTIEIDFEDYENMVEKITALEDQVFIHKEMLRKLQEEKEEINQEKEANQKYIEFLKKDIDEYKEIKKKEINELKIKINQKNQALKDFETIITQFHNQINQKDQKIKDFQEMKEFLTKTNKETNENLNSVSDELHQLKTDFYKIHEENSKIKEKNESLLPKISKIKEKRNCSNLNF